MIHQMYVILDNKSAIYNKPFFFINDAVAIRAAQDLLDQPDHEIAKHPEDYTMFKLGTYDDETAFITTNDGLPVLIRFHEIANKTQRAA